MAVLKPLRGGYYLWEYVPSVPAAVIFAVLFLLTTAFVFYRMIRTRTWFSTPFVIGGICTAPPRPLLKKNSGLYPLTKAVEIIGYAARVPCHFGTDQLPVFILQSVLILVAPALFAASVYMTLGRVIQHTPGGEARAVIPARWLTVLFVCGDVFSFLVQASGAGLAAMKNITPGLSDHIIVAGLVLQIVMFGFFVATGVVWDMRMRRGAGVQGYKTGWSRHMAMMYSVSALVLVRSVFRVVEYVMGKDGYLLQHEWASYVFDGVLMVVAVAVYGWLYPVLGKRMSTEIEL